MGGQPSSYPMIIRIFQSVKSWQISQICCIYRHDLNLGSSDIIVINITQPNKVVWVEREEPVWPGIIMYAFKKETLKVIHVRLTLSYNKYGTLGCFGQKLCPVTVGEMGGRWWELSPFTSILQKISLIPLDMILCLFMLI